MFMFSPFLFIDVDEGYAIVEEYNYEEYYDGIYLSIYLSIYCICIQVLTNVCSQGHLGIIYIIDMM